MRRVTRIIAAALLVLACARPASAQITWSGAFIGAYVGGGFKTNDFIVADSSQPPFFRMIDGPISHGLNFGGHVGIDRQIGKKILVGGEFGFGMLRYRGQVPYSLGNDTLAETDGGFAWTATARVGYVINHVMPYVAFGALGSKNTAHVVDACATPPCGTSLGEGSNTMLATRWVYAVGAEFAVTKRIAGRPWSIRLEWVQVDSSPLVNTFTRTLTGIGISPGTTAPVDVSTSAPRGMLRVLVDIRLKK